MNTFDIVMVSIIYLIACGFTNHLIHVYYGHLRYGIFIFTIFCPITLTIMFGNWMAKETFGK